ncbi:unnamed protein product [Calypogeia fissa]
MRVLKEKSAFNESIARPTHDRRCWLRSWIGEVCSGNGSDSCLNCETVVFALCQAGRKSIGWTVTLNGINASPFSPSPPSMSRSLNNNAITFSNVHTLPSDSVTPSTARVNPSRKQRVCIHLKFLRVSYLQCSPAQENALRNPLGDPGNIRYKVRFGSV